MSNNLKSNFQTQSIEKAKQLRQQLGGTIFSFPLEEDNPFSSYAIVMYAGGQYFPYPNATDISEAASGILILLEEMKKSGMDADYERNVRLVSYQAQMDAPSTVMHRLKKENTSRSIYREGTDVSEGSEETGHLLTARGVLKFTYLAMIEDKKPKAIQFMERYYQLLAMRKFGKTAAAIKQEVRKMGKDQAVKWIEQTYEKYIHDDLEIMNIFNSLK
jgi:hypothetical protein